MGTVLEKSEKTRLVLNNISELPPIPKVIREALKILDSDNASIFHLSKVIAQDQSLVTKILAIANSPFYGLQRKVANIEFALTIVGVSETRNIVSTLTMIETFKNKTDKYLNQKEFWLHSFISGLAAKKLAEDLNLLNSSEAFIAGFLHDIGVSIIHRYFHSTFVEIYDKVNNSEGTYTDVESELLGLDHARIGFELLDKWNFPVELCEAVMYHHNPELCENNSKLAALINLIDYLTQELKIGEFKWDEDATLSEFTRTTLNLDDFGTDEELKEKYKDLFQKQFEAIRYLV